MLAEREAEVKAETVGDLELHQSLAEVEAEKRGDTLHDVEAEALADTLADNLEDEKAVKISETLTDLKATSPVVTLAPTLAEIKAKTAGKILSDAGQILVVTPSATVAEVLEKSFKNTLTFLKLEVTVKKVVDTPADVDA